MKHGPEFQAALDEALAKREPHEHQQLRWFQAWADYALALVAAASEAEALAMIRAKDADTRWQGATEDRSLPGPPTAPGVYMSLVQ